MRYSVGKYYRRYIIKEILWLLTAKISNSKYFKVKGTDERLKAIDALIAMVKEAKGTRYYVPSVNALLNACMQKEMIIDTIIAKKIRVSLFVYFRCGNIFNRIRFAIISQDERLSLKY